MQKDLTSGNITKTMLLFAAPMIAGNMLQQFYNIADSLIVGKFVSSNALGAVGSAYSLMTFITSALIGLCMGSGALFSFYRGKQDDERLGSCVRVSFVLIGIISLIFNVLSFVLIDRILVWLSVPAEIKPLMRSYIFIVFFGIMFTFLYNFFAFLLRSLGNSVVPLYFLGATVIFNIALDLLFIIKFGMKIEGAAAATVIAQAIAGIGIALYSYFCIPEIRTMFTPVKSRSSAPASAAGAHGTISAAGTERTAIFTPHSSFWQTAGEILRFSAISSLQQSVMNFGILMIQGLVNSFGPAVMAAFAAVVKIDSFAYMPAQEFGNAYSLFISQNYGAGKHERVQEGTKKALQLSALFCVIVSVLVFVCARLLMLIFLKPDEYEIIAVGIEYLHIEGAAYIGIGILFLLYGYYRGINRPSMSLVLTALSLGTRVALAYALAPVPQIGTTGIWLSIPIGWVLADIVGLLYMRRASRQMQEQLKL